MPSQIDDEKRERLMELSTLLGGSAELAANFRKNEDFAPRPGSPAFRGEGQPYEKAALSAWDLGSWQLIVVDDLLKALALVIEGHQNVFSCDVLVRSLLEIAARAWYLLDPQASADVLAARYYNEVLFDIEQNLKLGVGSEDVLREEHEHRQKILGQAAAEGLGISTDKNGKPLNVGQSRPSATELVNDFWTCYFGDVPDAEDDMGSFLYRIYSATTHGRYTAFRRYASSGVDEEGQIRGAINLTSEAVESWTKVAVGAWHGAFGRQVESGGWDKELLDSWFRQTAKVFLGLRLRRVPGPR